MSKLVRLHLIFIFIVFTLATQAQDTGLIYEQVLELQDEFPKESKEIFKRNASPIVPSGAEAHIKKATYFELDDAFVQLTKLKRPNVLHIELPIEGKKVQALLYQKNITSASYHVQAASGAQTDISNSIFYRGILKDKPNSLVSLSLTTNGLHMTIADDKGNVEINKVSENLYAAYRIADSKHNQDMGCGTDESYMYKNSKIKTNSNNDSRSGECIEVYIECDFDSYTKNGSSIQNTEDWALAIMNEVGILYDNAGIPMFVSDILVYDQPDPYLAGGSSGEVLGLMGSVIGNNYNGRLAHVFSTRGLGGGVAYVNVLCATNSGGSYGPYAVSGSMNTNIVPFPIYSWNVMVVAHELGHNVGSLHTHNCVWNGNNTQIDDCGNQATSQGDNAQCYDENNPILPVGGSIMSYCHLIGSIGIDFNIGFHPLVADLLFDRYISASCVTGEECTGGTLPIADFTFDQSEICNPTEVQFTDLSQNNPTGHLWVFQGGEPSVSTDPNPTVFYSEPGLYDVSLTVSNFAGEDDLYLFQAIEVVETPIPDFDSAIEEGVVKFTNQTTGSIYLTFWDFGDGSSSTDENPCYAFEEDGSYPVTLTVESICGVFEIEKYVDFFTPPVAAFEADPTIGCTSMLVNFNNQSTDNSTDYQWTFEGGIPETSTEENPTVEYNSAGVYDVMLIATNDLGKDTFQMVDYIILESIPEADFDYAIDSLEITFTNISESYDTLVWDFGDGSSSTAINPTHTYFEEGIYDVTLQVSNSCDTMAVVKTILISSLPVAGYAANVTQGCLPLTVEFSNTSSSNSDTWKWAFPGGTPSSSTEEHPVITFNEVGEFGVSLIVENESGTDTLNTINLITVSDVPTANFDFAINDLNIMFTNTSTGQDSTHWDFGDGNTSLQTNPIHTYEEDGMYEVVLTTINECGSNTSVQLIMASTWPTAGFTSSISEGCVPFTVEYSNTSSSNATIVLWEFPGGTPLTSTEENPIITYETEGIYDALLIVSSLSGNDTLVIEEFLISKDGPTAAFDYEPLSAFEFTFTNLSINSDAFFWDFGDGSSSTEENPSHLYELPGIYTVMLTAENECGNEMFQQEITISDITSIAEIKTFNDVNVFPNPTTGEFIISIHSTVSSDVDLEIFTPLGQSIFADNVNLNTGISTRILNLNDSPPGVYFLMISNQAERHIVKVFLE